MAREPPLWLGGWEAERRGEPHPEAGKRDIFTPLRLNSLKKKLTAP
jgi:hypothetical protein